MPLPVNDYGLFGEVSSTAALINPIRATWPETCKLQPLTFFFEKVRAMFLYQLLLFVGGLATILLAISAVCPIRQKQSNYGLLGNGSWWQPKIDCS